LFNYSTVQGVKNIELY